MKILFVLPEYYPHSGGGISTYYLEYINALKNEVDEVEVLVGSGHTQSDEEYKLDGIKIEYLKTEIFNRYLSKFSKFDLQPEYRNNIAASWAMWEQCEQGKGYDIIECTDFGLGFIPWLVNHNLPVVVRLHGSSGQIDLFETYKKGLSADLHRQAEFTLLKHADLIVSHSTANKIYWENIFERQDIEVVYPIYESTKVSSSFLEKENYGIVCGRVQEWKGPDVLCEALSLIDTTNVIIKWFGRDTPFNETIGKNEQLKKTYPAIWGNVVLPQKPLPQLEIAKVQAKAKYAIIPSTWDMFNFTGLEYLNAGTLLICSDGAGVSELIEDGVNGFIYPKDNAKELGRLIEKVLQIDQQEYEVIVTNAKKTLVEKLNAYSLVNANLCLYRRISSKGISAQSNVFIEELFKPNQFKNSIDTSLNQLSIKRLINYLFKRIKKKL